jgi:ribosomal protein L11 methyltransferase
MPYLQYTVDIGRSPPEPWEEALFDLGALSVTLEDAADDPVLEPAPGETPLWPTIRVKALFPAEADRLWIAASVAGRLPDAREGRFEAVVDKAWEREWLKDFRPMRFGRRLWICPGGLPAEDPDAVRIELDPGLAFGTGTHPTTAMCLEWLDGHELQGREVVDYGCGSGVLAIAALKLGAARTLAMDIDPQALIATRENAARNHVAAALEVTGDPALARASADVLLANILAGPLVELAPRLSAAVRPGGDVLLRGILVEQAQTVTAAYRPWFDIALAATRDGWGLLHGRRRAN